MILVPETQLQHLLGVQLFQFGVGRRSLPTEESYKAREGPELIWLFMELVQLQAERQQNKPRKKLYKEGVMKN